MFERYSYVFFAAVMKVSLLLTQSILFGCKEELCKVGEKFGFEVSHPTHTPITKPALRKPSASPARSMSYAHHSELVPVGWRGEVGGLTQFLHNLMSGQL